MSKLIKQKMYQQVILLFVLGVILVTAGCARRQQVERDVEIVTQPMLDKLYHDAEALKSARKTTEAIARYKIFLTQHPTGPHVPQIYSWMGRAYVWNGEIKQGLTLFEKLIAEYPNCAQVPGVLFDMHLAHLSAKEDEKALAKLQQLIDTYPDTYMGAQARFIRGKYYYNRGAYQNAIEASKQVLTDIKDPFKSLLWRGMALQVIGESHRKLKQYEQAIEAVKQSIDAIQALQENYKQQGMSTENFGGARAQARRLLGDTYRDAGRYDEAVSSYNHVINTYPNDYNTPLALYAMAQIFSEQGKTEQAIEIYQQLVARDANYRERVEKEIALLNQASGENKTEK